MAKYQSRIEARKMRENGESIKSIAKKLLVSTSSVSLWVRDVILSKEQYQKLERNAKDPHYGNRLAYINKVKERTNKKIEKLKNKGIEEVGNITRRELFIAGIALYWSEGFKKDSQVGFANSDPKMINLFLRWLTECFGYKTEDFAVRVTLNISHKHRITEIEKYWSDSTKIPLSNFRKPFFQNVKWQKTYDNPNTYFGLLRLKVLKSKDFLRKILGYIEGLRLQTP